MGKPRWTMAAAGLIIIACLTLFLHKSETNSPGDAPAPTAVPGPLSGVTVCVDPGHGGYDGGAYGVSGTAEKEINLDVSLRLADALRQEGARVVLTRETDTALADPGKERKRRDLQYRVDQAAEADIFLSIHQNEYRTGDQSGPQVFYRKGQAKSRLLAGFLQEAMNAALAPSHPRSALTGEYYLLEHLDIPAVLVECGFLSNAAEEKKLRDPEYRQLVADSICAGVMAFVAAEQSNP